MHGLIKAIGLVNWLYVNSKIQRYWIIDWCVFDPVDDAKSKLTHMEGVFDQSAQIEKSPFWVVLMDAWYTVKDLMLHLHRADKIFYCPSRATAASMTVAVSLLTGRSATYIGAFETTSRGSWSK